MIQEKDFLYRVPVKNALVTAPGQQVRNPEILVDVEGGEFMHGNILDANSTNKLINQSVKDAVDNKLVESGYVIKELLENETKARTKGDEDLGAKIKAEQTRATGVESNLQTAISAKQDAGYYVKYDMEDRDTYYLSKGIRSKQTFIWSEGSLDAQINPTAFLIRNTNKSRFAVITPEDLQFISESKTVSYSSNGISVADQPASVPLTNSTFKPISDFVLTTNLSTYDKKIAALEARIAALEAKHPETAA